MRGSKPSVSAPEFCVLNVLSRKLSSAMVIMSAACQTLHLIIRYNFICTQTQDVAKDIWKACMAPSHHSVTHSMPHSEASQCLVPTSKRSRSQRLEHRDNKDVFLVGRYLDAKRLAYEMTLLRPQSLLSCEWTGHQT